MIPEDPIFGGCPNNSLHDFNDLLSSSGHSTNTKMLDDFEVDSTNSISGESGGFPQFQLKRVASNSSSFSGSGYLFLAMVFCVMCCSSFIASPENFATLHSHISANLQTS